MREIKFRFWDKEFKRFSNTPQKYEIQDINYYTDYEIMEYTGLKDKNNNDIYEGDILEFIWEEDSCWGQAGTYKGYIRFNEGEYELVYINRKNSKVETDPLKNLLDWSEEIEIIGNIYENPKLLEE